MCFFSFSQHARRSDINIKRNHSLEESVCEREEKKVYLTNDIVVVVVVVESDCYCLEKEKKREDGNGNYATMFTVNLMIK